MQAGYEGVSFEEPHTCGMLGREPRRAAFARPSGADDRENLPYLARN